MTAAITIRPAVLGDEAALAAIHVAGYEEAYRGLIPDAVLDERTEDLRRRVWGERLADPQPREFVLLAELDGAPAGFVSGRPAASDEDDDPERVACWENLYIAPEHLGGSAGFRLGLELHRATLAAAREHGFTEAVAFPIDGNTRAARFFEAVGWRPDGGTRASDGVSQRRLRRALDQ